VCRVGSTGKGIVSLNYYDYGKFINFPSPAGVTRLFLLKPFSPKDFFAARLNGVRCVLVADVVSHFFVVVRVVRVIFL